MENETSMAVISGVVVSILALLEIIFIPGTAFKVIALILTHIAGSGYLFYVYRDFSSHTNYLMIAYSGFGCLLFLTSMDWLTLSIGKSAIFAAAVTAFMVPVVFCSVTAFVMRETQRNFYGEFFVGQCIILALSLLLFYIHWFSRYNLDRTLTGPSVRMVPFATLASFIEQLIYGQITAGEFARYLGFCIVVYIPFGYLVGALGEKIHIILELMLVLIFPAIMEFIQYFFILNTCDIDDMFLGFLGGLLGIAVFKLFNMVSLYMTGTTLTGVGGRMD